MSCPTCNMIRGLLMASGAPAPVLATAEAAMPSIERLEDKVSTKVKRKTSAYNRRYKSAFKRIKSRYMKKDGTWKKGGFKRAVKDAHRLARGGR